MVSQRGSSQASVASADRMREISGVGHECDVCPDGQGFSEP